MSRSPARRAAILLRAAAASSLFLGVAASGCGPETSPPVETDAGTDAKIGCTLPFIGDAAKDLEIEIIALRADYTSAPVAAGDSVALLFPPQGGRVIFAGVRARNVDPCNAQLLGAVRDLDTQQVRVDSRTINLEATDDGWGRSADSDIASFANVPMCPNSWSKPNIYGTTYELEVTLTDRDKRKATKIVEVMPACAEPENAAECACICKGGYILGEMCGDGGAGGMSP
jgi:hypothetical protein